MVEIPSTEDLEKPSTQDLEFASIFFGLFIGLFLFTTMKVARQTWRIWGRTKSVLNFYLCAILVETAATVIFAITTYLFLRGDILPSFGYYFCAVSLWTIQTQLFLQIIANRVGLIMVNKRKARLIKWILFVVVGLINISVYCIWIPALMESNPTFVKLNHIWERVEKSLFLLLDAGLNLYFLYLVRSNLIAKGLTKYWPLFKFNAAIVLVSVAMDTALIGMLSLPNTYDYVQFFPIVYNAKLYIELTMAELISKVVRSSQRVDERRSNDINERSSGVRRYSMSQSHAYFPGTLATERQHRGETKERQMPISASEQFQGQGILKTVTTLIGTDSREDLNDSCSEKTTARECDAV